MAVETSGFHRMLSVGPTTHSGTLEKMIGADGMSPPDFALESKPLPANSLACAW